MLPATDPVDASASDAGLDAEAELVVRRLETAARYLFTNLLPLPLVIVGLSVLLGQWHQTGPLLIWAAIATGTWIMTMAVIHKFRTDAARAQNARRWTIVLCAFLFVSTSSFASVSPLFWVEGDRLNNVLLYVVLAGGMACAGAQSAPSFPIAAINLGPYALMFLSVSLMHEAYPIAYGVAALQLCYVCLVALYAREVWQLSDEMLRLRIEKRSLIEKLQSSLVATRAARQKAEEASRAKSEFLASMSHELRTPLNAILGFSEIIKDRMFGDDAMERYAEYGEHIHFGGKHLLGLIGDILDLSKIEAGKRELHEEPLDLTAVARDSMSLVEPQAAHKSLVLSLVAPAPLAMRADERALRQVMANLLSNAVKFTPDAGHVTLTVVAHADGGASISVVDTGVGIQPNDMEHVLERFRQGRHDIAATEHQGTGLGLPIVKGLVELHGGTFAIESTPNVGTIVTVVLPASRMIARPSLVSAA